MVTKKFTNNNSSVRHDDHHLPVKIPRQDWFKLPADQRDALGGRPYVLSNIRTRQAFVPAILL